MQRRGFLKLAGLGAIAAALSSPFGVLGAAGASSVATLNGITYRGDRRGRIFSSRNGGASWQVHTNFGPRYAVTSIALAGTDGIRATLVFRRRAFGLVLAADGMRWMTA